MRGNFFDISFDILLVFASLLVVVALVRIVPPTQRKTWSVLSLGSFILLCGAMPLIARWRAAESLHGSLKLIAALAGISAAVLLLRFLPKTLRLMHPGASSLRWPGGAEELGAAELQTVFDNAPVGIGFWDRSLRFIRVNEELAQMIGRPKDDHGGKTVSDLLPKMSSRITEPILRVLQTGEPVRDVEIEGETPAQPGAVRYWLFNFFPVLVGAQVKLVGAVAEEITDRKLSEHALRDREHAYRTLAESLMRANQDLEHFAYAASHDLQEPLRTILLYGQLIQKRHASRLEDSGRAAVDHIVAGANRMSALLRDLRAYVKSGQIPVGKLQPVAAGEVLRDVLQDLKAAIDETGASITKDDLPVLHMDRAHLAQILQNLISNALKYHGAASPEVHVGTRLDGEEQTFYVRDNGEGIDPEYQHKIFGAFQRLHGQARSGSGLGLTICSRIVAIYGGRLWLESKPGRGSTFFFTVPRAQLDGASSS